MALIQTRRGFVAGFAAAGAAGLLQAPYARAAEGSLETTTIRLVKNAGICVSPQYVAEKLLRDEGFTDIRYVDTPVPEISAAIARGKVDIAMNYDPDRDIRWVTDPKVKPIELFVAGKIDAFLAFPPESQDLRARGIGHVILDTAVDQPWSQYYCCVLAGNPEYVSNHPVATKRALRAILKAADLCASDPQRAAQQIVDRGFTPRYDYALETLTELPYDKWREYDPEDTMRFYALRLHESGLIKSDPKKIIAENTEWRFFNELKRELKA
jgi:NitT/TauT family transport system substrate-binding protein